ncbi:hypothetical protein ANN_13980 [Periplaneta americana]|uniref:Uncharacterized protein n=1 Tax=Periplaneta americana TaxID=6978 RepID=A0ABQ8SV13_PERAM|nr:hypothetical protein ANN_13980 [Periplaneta americana]
MMVTVMINAVIEDVKVVAVVKNVTVMVMEVFAVVIAGLSGDMLEKEMMVTAVATAEKIPPYCTVAIASLCHSDVSSSPFRRAVNTALPLRRSARSLSAVCAVYAVFCQIKLKMPKDKSTKSFLIKQCLSVNSDYSSDGDVVYCQVNVTYVGSSSEHMPAPIPPKHHLVGSSPGLAAPIPRFYINRRIIIGASPISRFFTSCATRRIIIGACSPDTSLFTSCATRRIIIGACSPDTRFFIMCYTSDHHRCLQPRYPTIYIICV